MFVLQQPGRDPIAFPAHDQGHAVCLVDLLKQGMFDREMGWPALTPPPARSRRNPLAHGL